MTGFSTDSRWKRAFIPLAAAVLGLVLMVLSCTDSGRRRLLVAGTPDPPTNRPISVVGKGYVSADTCRACHPWEYETWHSSFHRTMTQVVSPETVVASWEGELDLRGEKYLLERRGDEFWVEMNDPDWKEAAPPPRVWKQVVMSTGSHHFQAYWFSAEKKRQLSLFLMCYRIDEGKWIPVDSAFINPPEHHRDTGRGRWNTSCLNCHATKGQPRLSPEGMDTHVVDFGISCEACHGPAAEHVTANRNPLHRYEHHLGREVTKTIINPTELPPRRGVQACAQCHALTILPREKQRQRWAKNGFAYRPGEDLFSRRALVGEGEDYFWPDGRIRVSGREYNGLVESPCYQHEDTERILTCFSCHEMHRDADDPRPISEWRDDQLKANMRGNQACTQCHAEYLDEDVLTGHTHHAASSVGSTCYDCHMPHTDWGLLKTSRSHQVSSPDVGLDHAAGRPNACNLCHLDRTLDWGAQRLEDWYDIEPPELTADERTIGSGVLWALRGDAGLRGIAAWHMGWAPAREASGTEWMAPILAHLLVDPYDAVGFRAFSALREVDGFAELEYDFVGPRAERERSRRLALEAWEAMLSGPVRANGSEVLLDERGHLMKQLFDRLASERDDRPVVLAE